MHRTVRPFAQYVYSIFSLFPGLTQVFGGFVAYGISFDSGHLIAPYKIIYILLGGLAILVGVCVVIWLPDSPVHARVLTKEERVAALERVRDDQGGTENKKIKKDQVIEALTDVRTWLIALTTLMSESYMKDYIALALTRLSSEYS